MALFGQQSRKDEPVPKSEPLPKPEPKIEPPPAPVVPPPAPPVTATTRRVEEAPMSMTTPKGNESILSAGLTIEGKIEGNGNIRVAGRFKGNVSVKGELTIEPGATTVIACGVTPRVGLARAAGLAVNKGLIVDDALRSVTDPSVHAIGACAEMTITNLPCECVEVIRDWSQIRFAHNQEIIAESLEFVEEHGWWLVVSGWRLVVGAWWLVVGGWSHH